VIDYTILGYLYVEQISITLNLRRAGWCSGLYSVNAGFESWPEYRQSWTRYPWISQTIQWQYIEQATPQIKLAWHNLEVSHLLAMFIIVNTKNISYIRVYAVWTGVHQCPVVVVLKIYDTISTKTCLVRKDDWQKKERLSTLLNKQPTRILPCCAVARLETPDSL
jgi:hypothetical protein